MKQLLFLLLFTSSGEAFCQQTDSAADREAGTIIRKNNGQRIAGAVFTVAGGAVVAATFLANLRSSVSRITIPPYSTPPTHHSYTLGYLLGGGALLTGIILLATSDDHRVPAPGPAVPAGSATGSGGSGVRCFHLPVPSLLLFRRLSYRSACKTDAGRFSGTGYI